ncbi:hypothetical protein PoB_002131700 [Plakobranchus ocellatus]|uniref:Valyl-tRNA synthetase tRNA-binding arm domain-containing protein n=1 Tax=Plakobranchus ocellatus TaxID=259542 RepID=A0AAV3ZJT3_9GAST|nr:hypothetical protein PoB_002131700 [Plakobranchus ocellatus]
MCKFKQDRETLEIFKSALAASAGAQGDLQEQIDFQKLPETAGKIKEYKEAEKRLREVEAKLSKCRAGV